MVTFVSFLGFSIMRSRIQKLNYFNTKKKKDLRCLSCPEDHQTSTMDPQLNFFPEDSG